MNQIQAVNVTHPQSYTWDSVSDEIVSSKKFKWLRERMGGHSLHTTLLNQMKSFVVAEEGDAKGLLGTLQKQVSVFVQVTLWNRLNIHLSIFLSAKSCNSPSGGG